MFNAFVIVAIGSSALCISMLSADAYGSALLWTDYLGISVWIVGFLFLTIADH
jgi:steroid 5-alpha reductase family enzyme